MWIVLLALRRPYTFVVAALLLVLLTPLILMRTPTDIFPAINIPVISIIWQYTGLDAKQFEQRITYTHERILTVTVNNIQHIESTSYNGISRGESVSTAGCFRGFRRRPDHRFRPDRFASDAAGHATAVDHPIQRVLGADFAI